MTDQFEKFLLERVLHRIDQSEQSPGWLGTLVLWAVVGGGSYFLFSRNAGLSLATVAAASFVFGAFAGHAVAKAWQSLWWPFVVRYIDSAAVRARLAQLQA